jgi:orotidine-5'-phosphate decarboxylase
MDDTLQRQVKAVGDELKMKALEEHLALGAKTLRQAKQVLEAKDAEIKLLRASSNDAWKRLQIIRGAWYEWTSVPLPLRPFSIPRLLRRIRSAIFAD